MKESKTIKVSCLEELSEKFKNEVLSKFKEQGISKLSMLVARSKEIGVTTIIISTDLLDTLDILNLLVTNNAPMLMLSIEIPGHIETDKIF